jgi:hypothetical protein
MCIGSESSFVDKPIHSLFKVWDFGFSPTIKKLSDKLEYGQSRWNSFSI